MNFSNIATHWHVLIHLPHICNRSQGSKSWSPSLMYITSLSSVIRCPNGDSTATCVYALVQYKTRQIHEDLFNAASRCAVLQLQPAAPTNLHLDFEAAVHQAGRVVFPGATINGRLYHLTQVNNFQTKNMLLA